MMFPKGVLLEEPYNVVAERIFGLPRESAMK
jgi:hypothetical protein